MEERDVESGGVRKLSKIIYGVIFLLPTFAGKKIVKECILLLDISSQIDNVGDWSSC